MMRNVSLFVATALLGSAALPAAAQSVFDGTWRIAIDSMQQQRKPDVVLLKDGIFSCESCAPAFTVKADGAFHPVSGHVYDSVAITVLGPRSTRTQRRKNGRIIDTETDTLSADGNTLTAVDVDSSATSGKITRFVSTQRRMGSVPAGAHATSGTWDSGKVVSSDANVMTFKSDGKRLDARAPSGEHYLAVFGGPYVPVEGSAAKQMVAATRDGPRAFTVRIRDGGEDRSSYTMTINPDGRTATIVSRGLRSGSTATATARKE